MHGRRVLAVAIGCLLLGRSAAGQQPVQPAPPASDQEFARTVPYEERIAAQGNVRRLTAREAVELAVENNLDLAIERYNEELARQRVRFAQGYYDPLLSFAAARSSAENPGTGASGGRRSRSTASTSPRWGRASGRISPEAVPRRWAC